MKPWSSIVLAIAALLLTLPAHADDSSKNYHLTMSKYGNCLHTRNDEGVPIKYCDTEYLTVEMKAILATAVKTEKMRLAEIMKLDPRTPKLDSCVADRASSGYLDFRLCGIALSSDLSALAGFFTKGERAVAAETSGMAKMAEMEKLADQTRRDMMTERIDRRANQTPLQNAIDKLSEPCLYADSNHRMQSCD